MSRYITDSKSLLPLCLLLLLAACDQRRQVDAVQEFVNDTLSHPSAPIEPMPTFAYYEPFTYNAYKLRSPFDIPKDVSMVAASMNSAPKKHEAESNVQPDANRLPEPLEKFALSQLGMVGTITRGDTIWALIEDSGGIIHRVSHGSYIGLDLGRIIGIDDAGVDIVEIIASDLPGKWMERPQSIRMENGD